MTAPERLRSRQLVEGALLILIGIGMLVQSYYFETRDDSQDRQDTRQQECLVDNFQELTVALDARADLAARETAVTKRIWEVYAEAAGLLREDPTKPLTKADQDRLNRDLVEALLAYQAEIEKIEKERRANPLPPYPKGQCSG